MTDPVAGLPRQLLTIMAGFTTSEAERSYLLRWYVQLFITSRPADFTLTLSAALYDGLNVGYWPWTTRGVTRLPNYRIKGVKADGTRF